MSVADVETVREMYEAFNRGDYETATAMLHERAELHQPRELVGTDSYFGRDEFVRGFARWQSGFEPGFQYEVVELVDAGECVLMRLNLRGRGRASGAEVEQESFNVWEVRDSKPFRCRIFSEERPAREAAGLPR
jgi:ketosteroid isomerase-like protein